MVMVFEISWPAFPVSRIMVADNPAMGLTWPVMVSSSFV